MLSFTWKINIVECSSCTNMPPFISRFSCCQMPWSNAALFARQLVLQWGYSLLASGGKGYVLRLPTGQCQTLSRWPHSPPSGPFTSSLAPELSDLRPVSQSTSWLSTQIFPACGRQVVRFAGWLWGKTVSRKRTFKVSAALFTVSVTNYVTLYTHATNYVTLYTHTYMCYIQVT